MQEYVKNTIDKIQKLANEHPGAELKFGSHAMCWVNILPGDIAYDAHRNIIFVGI